MLLLLLFSRGSGKDSVIVGPMVMRMVTPAAPVQPSGRDGSGCEETLEIVLKKGERTVDMVRIQLKL